jgi:hypothetical protein
MLSMTRQELHRLVDELPETSIEAVGHWLERAKDPMVAILDAAPDDDEPFDEQARAAALAALSEPAVSWERARADLTD